MPKFNVTVEMQHRYSSREKLTVDVVADNKKEAEKEAVRQAHHQSSHNCCDTELDETFIEYVGINRIDGVMTEQRCEETPDMFGGK